MRTDVSTLFDCWFVQLVRVINTQEWQKWLECSECCLMVPNISVKFHETTWNGFKVTKRTQVYDQNHYLQCSKGHNSKVCEPELWFLCSACRLKVVNISVKFHGIIWNKFSGYRVDTSVWPKSLFTYSTAIIAKVGNQELWFLSFTCCLMVNISVKFDKISHTLVKLIKPTSIYDRNHYLQCSESPNSQSWQTRVMVLIFCVSFHVAKHFCKVSWKYLNFFSSYRSDMSIWPKSLFTMFKNHNPKSR